MARGAASSATGAGVGGSAVFGAIDGRGTLAGGATGVAAGAAGPAPPLPAVASSHLRRGREE